MPVVSLHENLILPSFMQKLECYLLSGIYITYVWKPRLPMNKLITSVLLSTAVPDPPNSCE